MLRTLALGATLALAVAVVGCGPSEAERQSAAREQDWAWLQQAKSELDAKRVELAQARAELAQAAGQAASEAAAEAAQGAAALAARVEQLEKEVGEAQDAFGQRLVQFINDDPWIRGEQPTERQLAAVRMKSDEDMVLAREYIERGGDYRRAIEIYQTALTVDPDNQALKDALARAESERFMTEERFAQVSRGMTQDQVRAVLGQVNPRNIRDYPEKNVSAWFYPKQGGGAAGVFFEKNRDGAFVVYQTDFTAVTR